MAACAAGDVTGAGLARDASPDAAPLDGALPGDAAGADAPRDDAPDAQPEDHRADVAPPPPLRVARRDVPITPAGSVRQPSVCFHAGADAFATAYTWVLPAAPTPRFRVEVRAVTLSADGAPAASAPLLVDGDAPPHDAGEPRIAAPDRPDLPALVVWIDDRSAPGARGAIELYGRLVRLGGGPPSVSPAGEPFAISQRPGSDEHLPGVAWDAAAGSFLVAWADDRERGARHEDARVIYARRVAPDGRVGPELRVGDEGLFQTAPSVASCGDGRFLVTWTDYRAEGRTLVTRARGRILDARTGEARTAIALWGEAPSVPQDPVAAQCAPGGDGWVVAWSVGGPPSVRQVRVARLTRDGALDGEPAAPSALADGARAPDLGVATTGQTVLTTLAQDSPYGYASVLGDDVRAPTTSTPLTPAAPRLGTFWASVAASSRRAEALVVMTLDYDRLHATTLTAAP